MKKELKNAIEAAIEEFYRTVTLVTPLADKRAIGMLLMGMACRCLKDEGVTLEEFIEGLKKNWKV